MDTESALAALEASLARPSSTPCTWADDREAYVEEQKRSLRSALLPPRMVKASAGTWAREYAGADAVEREYIALAHSEETWLLYCPRTRQFAKAFGSPDSQVLSLLGFSSDDALAEWLG